MTSALQEAVRNTDTPPLPHGGSIVTQGMVYQALPMVLRNGHLASAKMRFKAMPGHRSTWNDTHARHPERLLHRVEDLTRLVDDEPTKDAIRKMNWSSYAKGCDRAAIQHAPTEMLSA